MAHSDITEARFVQNGRLGTHLTNVDDASPKGYLTPDHHEVHHILCHSCVQDAAIYVGEVDKEYVQKCLAITDWDVNNPKNLIGLPLKTAYLPEANGGKYSEAEKWDKLPCHQVDHNPHYTEAVKTWLHKNIWNTLKGGADNCNPDPKSIKGMLDRGSKRWQRFLLRRGNLHDGTKDCWDNRHGAKKDVWWMPFSLWPEEDTSTIPRRRAPRAVLEGSPKMKSLFKKIKQKVK